MLSSQILSLDLQAKFIASGAAYADAQGNPTKLKESCDIISNSLITHVKTFGQVTVNNPLIGVVVGVGGGVPGPVTGTATIPSGILLPTCIQ